MDQIIQLGTLERHEFVDTSIQHSTQYHSLDVIRHQV